jgi:uncharacterized protein YycO
LKKVFYFVIVLFISIALFLFIYENNSKQEQILSTYTLNQNELKKIKDGDIILRHGYGMVSDMIADFLNNTQDVSHCAIITQNDTGFSVVHSVSQSLSDYDGVQTQDLKTFIRDSKKNSVIVLRYKNSKDICPSPVSKYAKYYLKKKVPFDHSFDITDTSEFYCTELIWKVFKDAYDVDIFSTYYGDDDIGHLKFKMFTDTNYFEEIINHHNRKN